MQEPPNRFSRFNHWIPAIIVAILISTFSTRSFAEDHTGWVILPALHWLFPWANARTVHLMHTGIRKFAHLTEFAIFSVLVFRGLRGGRTGWKLTWAIATLLIAAAYASLDELHQSFVPTRGPSIRDVAIDIFGALLTQLGVWLYARRAGKRPYE